MASIWELPFWSITRVDLCTMQCDLWRSEYDIFGTAPWNHPSGPNVKIRVKPNLCRLWLFEYCPSRTLHQLWMDTFAAAIYNGTKSIPAAIMFRLADTTDDRKKVSLLCQRKTREEVAEPPALERIARRNAGGSTCFLLVFSSVYLFSEFAELQDPFGVSECFSENTGNVVVFCVFFRPRTPRTPRTQQQMTQTTPVHFARWVLLHLLRMHVASPFVLWAHRRRKQQSWKIKFWWKTSKFSFQIQGKSLAYGINMTRIILQALWTLDIEDILVHPVSKW